MDEKINKLNELFEIDGSFLLLDDMLAAIISDTRYYNILLKFKDFIIKNYDINKQTKNIMSTDMIASIKFPELLRSYDEDDIISFLEIFSKILKGQEIYYHILSYADKKIRRDRICRDILSVMKPNISESIKKNRYFIFTYDDIINSLNENEEHDNILAGLLSNNNITTYEMGYLLKNPQFMRIIENMAYNRLGWHHSYFMDPMDMNMSFRKLFQIYDYFHEKENLKGINIRLFLNDAFRTTTKENISEYMTYTMEYGAKMNIASSETMDILGFLRLVEEAGCFDKYPADEIISKLNKDSSSMYRTRYEQHEYFEYYHNQDVFEFYKNNLFHKNNLYIDFDRNYIGYFKNLRKLGISTPLFNMVLSTTRKYFTIYTGRHSEQLYVPRDEKGVNLLLKVFQDMAENDIKISKNSDIFNVYIMKNPPTYVDDFKPENNILSFLLKELDTYGANDRVFVDLAKDKGILMSVNRYKISNPDVLHKYDSLLLDQII